jgi:hypothetical protein
VVQRRRQQACLSLTRLPPRAWGWLPSQGSPRGLHVLFPGDDVLFAAELTDVVDDLDPSTVVWDWALGDGAVISGQGPEITYAYATAGEFADDLTRLLDGRPVLARGDGAAYILWKAARRHALPTSIAAVSLILILSSIVALWMLYRESERRLQRAESVSKVYESAFEFVDPQAEGSIDLRAPDFIRRLERTARTALAEQPSDQAKMLLLAGDSFCNLELIDDADRCFRTGLELADSMGSPDARPLVAAAEHGLGRVDYFRGRDAGRGARRGGDQGRGWGRRGRHLRCG